MAAAFERFWILSEILIFFGIIPLETFVLLGGTSSLGIAIHKARFFGGSILITSRGFVLTITNPPSKDAATLS